MICSWFFSFYCIGFGNKKKAHPGTTPKYADGWNCFLNLFVLLTPPSFWLWGFGYIKRTSHRDHAIKLEKGGRMDEHPQCQVIQGAGGERGLFSRMNR